jgi:thiosulfate/3-mercaptopyruvate sulfurtransferase
MSQRTLVSAGDLAAMQAQRAVLVVDCRFDLADAGKAERDYVDAHIPGAVYAHLDHDLSDLTQVGAGRHPLPDEFAFAASLARWGWQPGMPVVACDNAGGALAASRLWWLLRLAGYPDVAVLDGGVDAWRNAGLAWETGVVTRESSTISIAFDREQVVGFEEIARRRNDGSMVLIDARAAPRYRGDVEPLDPVAGHVPGAVNRPFSMNLDGAGLFKSPQQLRAEFGHLIGDQDARDVVHMCGSGVTACHNLLAMEHAGLAGSRLFAPSWSGWVSDRSRPVETGSPGNS